jgi:hypothetical protein
MTSGNLTASTAVAATTIGAMTRRLPELATELQATLAVVPRNAISAPLTATLRRRPSPRGRRSPREAR